MALCAVWTDAAGNVKVTVVAPADRQEAESELEHLQRRIRLDLPVPESSVLIMPHTDLPKGRFRNAWMLDGGKVKVHPGGAKKQFDEDVEIAVEQNKIDQQAATLLKQRAIGKTVEELETIVIVPPITPSINTPSNPTRKTHGLV